MTENNCRAGTVTNDQSAIFIACAHRLDEVGSQYLAEELRSVQRELLAASPVEQPAAAPIDRAEMVKSWGEISSQMFAKMTPWQFYEAGWVASRAASTASSPACKRCGSTTAQACNDVGCFYLESGDGEPAPSPADERAAFVKLMGYDRPETEGVAVDVWDSQRATWLEALAFARAASANEMGAEGATQASEEFRQIALTELYEFQELTGCSTSDEYRAKLAAMAAEAVAIPAGFALVPIEPTPEILTAIWQNERDSRRAWERAIATVQQPAQAGARVGLTDALRRAREELSIVEWENDPPSRVVKLLDEIDALLAAHPGQPEPRAEATDDRKDKAKGLIKTLSDIIHDQTVAMQAAIIEWQHGKGAEAGLNWIVNTLSGPGHLPDFDAPHGKHAQFWFNANQANPLPACFCGNPSSSLWMGQGFCCDEHYREAKVKHNAAHAGDAS
ncbi:TPA: hypothetical protein ACT5B7_006666 [Burkholderia cenocepacia]